MNINSKETFISIFYPYAMLPASQPRPNIRRLVIIIILAQLIFIRRYTPQRNNRDGSILLLATRRGCVGNNFKRILTTHKCFYSHRAFTFINYCNISESSLDIYKNRSVLEFTIIQFVPVWLNPTRCFYGNFSIIKSTI